MSLLLTLSLFKTQAIAHSSSHFSNSCRGYLSSFTGAINLPYTVIHIYALLFDPVFVHLKSQVEERDKKVTTFFLQPPNKWIRSHFLHF